MKELRKRRLRELLAKRFKNDRAAFMKASGLTKGRVAQLLDEKEPFGDVAATRLQEKLHLPENFFDSAEDFGSWPSVRAQLSSHPAATSGTTRQERGAQLVSERAMAIARRLDKLPEPSFARAYALLDLTLRTLEQEAKAKPRSPKA